MNNPNILLCICPLQASLHLQTLIIWFSRIFYLLIPKVCPVIRSAFIKLWFVNLDLIYLTMHSSFLFGVLISLCLLSLSHVTPFNFTSSIKISYNNPELSYSETQINAKNLLASWHSYMCAELGLRTFFMYWVFYCQLDTVKNYLICLIDHYLIHKKYWNSATIKWGKYLKHPLYLASCLNPNLVSLSVYLKVSNI